MPRITYRLPSDSELRESFEYAIDEHIFINPEKFGELPERVIREVAKRVAEKLFPEFKRRFLGTLKARLADLEADMMEALGDTYPIREIVGDLAEEVYRALPKYWSEFEREAKTITVPEEPAASDVFSSSIRGKTIAVEIDPQGLLNYVLYAAAELVLDMMPEEESENYSVADVVRFAIWYLKRRGKMEELRRELERVRVRGLRDAIEEWVSSVFDEVWERMEKVIDSEVSKELRQVRVGAK